MSSSTGFVPIIKKTASEFSDDECSTMAAALAYYTAFSLPPLLVLIITVAGWIWSAEAVTAQVEQQVSSVVGEGGWKQVESMMKAADEKQSSGGFAAIIGIIALLFGATGVMVQLQAALNKAWEVQPDPEQAGLKAFLTKRVLSLAMIIAVAFLLLVSLVLTAVLNAMAGMVSSWMPAGTGSWLPLAINFVVSFVVFTLLFAAMFRWLPDAEVRWRDTWVGAGATALLFMIGKFALGMYFSMTDTGQYGAAASFVLLLLWVYYSGMIFLFGAEFTQVWAKRHGRQIMPEEGAVRVVEKTKHVRKDDVEDSSDSGESEDSEPSSTRPSGKTRTAAYHKSS